MIKPRFVSFTVWYCEEVCTKYPGTEPSNIKMQEVTFSNSQTETLSQSVGTLKSFIHNISERECKCKEGEGEGWRETEIHLGSTLSNKQMPGSVWGRLFSPVCVCVDLPGSVLSSPIIDPSEISVTAHTYNYQSLHNISKPLQSPVSWDNVYYDCHTAHYHITDVIVTFSNGLLWLKC